MDEELMELGDISDNDISQEEINNLNEQDGISYVPENVSTNEDIIEGNISDVASSSHIPQNDFSKEDNLEKTIPDEESFTNTDDLPGPIIVNLHSEIFSKHEILRQYGIIEDIKNFYKLCCEEESLSFYTFTKLYAENNMSVLFLGKFASYELVEISEYMLQYSAEFIVPLIDDNEKPYNPIINDEQVDRSKDDDPKNLKKIIFGIFLTYMFYNSQPSQYVVNIHIQVRQLQEIQRIMKEVLLKHNSYEAMYCLYCLLQHEAFTIVPFGNDYTFKIPTSRTLPNDGSERLPSIKNFDVVASAGNLNAYKNETNFKHMQICHERYTEMKNAFGFDKIQKVKTSPNELVEELESKYREKYQPTPRIPTKRSAGLKRAHTKVE
uniref:Uncharacterized protein n=1 Tax=Parastrongyloides trichosuri TaxID=131310 RepID=A0A0N4ZFZ6_PARTI